MLRHCNNKGRIILPSMLLALCLMLCLMWALYPDSVSSGPYLNSAHANTTYGVDRIRTGTGGFGYSKGNCAHCHEQHASIGGQTITPQGYELFYNNYVSQTDGVCFKCHDNTITISATGIDNYSYSYRAGGWTADTLNNIKDAFNPLISLSSHNLTDIRTFINGKWGYTADSNPCVACHNPHRAQGDPANSSLPKNSTTRGWPVSRPSQHSKDNNAWELWGDVSTERMSQYAGTGNYQAPYRYNTTSYLEPQGDPSTDPTTAAANTTDFVTFCTDCHNATNTIYSTTLGRNLKTIDWVTTGGDTTTSGDKHGKNSATTDICIKPPYNSTTSCTTSGLGKVLSCLDCHEPHGAPNVTLIRKEVNGGELISTITTIGKSSASAPALGPGNDNVELGYLCHRCHYGENNKADNCYIHHTSSDAPYGGPPGGCSNCHAVRSGGGDCTADVTTICCNNCHFHGSTDSWAPLGDSTGRRTF